VAAGTNKMHWRRQRRHPRTGTLYSVTLCGVIAEQPAMTNSHAQVTCKLCQEKLAHMEAKGK